MITVVVEVVVMMMVVMTNASRITHLVTGIFPVFRMLLPPTPPPATAKEKSWGGAVKNGWNVRCVTCDV